VVKLGSGEWISIFRLGRRGAKTLTLVSINVCVDVRLGREVGWVTCIVDRICPLVHSNIINRHGYWERQVFEVNETEVG
jgi:hypothetical protein